MQADVAEDLKRFIRDEVLWAESGDELNDDTPLLGGVLDSFGLQSLLTYIEENYEVRVSNDDLVSENFGNVRSIATLIESKRAAAQG